MHYSEKSSPSPIYSFRHLPYSLHATSLINKYVLIILDSVLIRMYSVEQHELTGHDTASIFSPYFIIIYFIICFIYFRHVPILRVHFKKVLGAWN